MKKRSLLFFLILFSVNSVRAQQLRLIGEGAVSKAAGENYNLFNWGFAVGGDLLFYLDDNLMVGARAAFVRWSPVDSEFLKNVGNLFNGQVSGNVTTVEILPIIRLTTNYPLSVINFFAQGGAGLYIVNTQVTVSGTSGTDSLIQESFGKNARGRFGYSVGAGFTFGSPEFISIDLYPLFNLVFLENSNRLKYFTFNIGLAVGI